MAEKFGDELRGPPLAYWSSDRHGPIPEPEGFDELDAKLNAIQEEGVDALAKLDAVPDGLLYHYTSPEALHAIVTNQRIWATHAAYLNDSTELIYADHVFAAAAGETPAKSAAARQFLDQVREIERLDTVSRFLTPFVACFSEERDVLSQWRAYAKDGLGFVAGFDPKCVFTVEGRDDLTVDLVRVRYERRDQLDMVLPVLKKIVAAVDETVGACTNARELELIINRTGAAFASVATPLSVALKNPGFKEEAEWRLVAYQWSWPTRAEFRPSRFGFSPYVKLTAGERLPLKAIGLGPQLSSEHARWSSENFLLRYGYGREQSDANYVELYQSRATYRG